MSMGLSKEQVKDHVSSIEAKLANEKERKLHGFEFSRLYFQIKDYENAIKYLSDYLTVKERDYRAQKWMGRLYEAVNDNMKAVFHYERSLELKKEQKDVILKVAELYVKIDGAPTESIMNALDALKKFSDNHPLIFSLTEQLQLRGGDSSDTSAVEELLKQQIRGNPHDSAAHIRLVNHCVKSGNLEQAFKYCQLFNQKEEFEECLLWQDCSLEIAEKYYELLKQPGNGDTYSILSTLIAILKSTGYKFRLQLKSVTSKNSVDLLMKFDHVLFTAHQVLKLISSKPTFYHIAVRECCGQLYLMAAQYLYLKKKFGIQLGDLCLLASLRATPPDLESPWSQPVGLDPSIKEWHKKSCTRLSVAGWQLLVVASCRGNDYFERTRELVKEKKDKFILIKFLFEECMDRKVPYGSNYIQYSLQQSFLAADDSFLLLQPNLPHTDDLTICDKDYVIDSKYDAGRLLWLCLVHKAIKRTPPISDWLVAMFPGCQLTTSNLTGSNPNSLCRCDLEAYLVLQCRKYEQQLFSGTSKQNLNSILAVLSPHCIHMEEVDIVWWKEVAKYLKGNLSVPDRKIIQDLVSYIRACSPLKLDMDQLSLLARHFNDQEMFEWSSHYWRIVHDVVNSKIKYDGQRKSLYFSRTPLSSTLDCDSLLAEAQLALANAALYKHDTSQALKYFSQVNTPQAAWNQSQIYILMAEQEDIDPQIHRSYLQKALDCLTAAIRKLNSSDDPELQDKLLSKQEKIKELLNESPIALHMDCDYKESFPLPQLNSTPARVKYHRSPKQKLLSHGAEVSFSESLEEALKDKDKQLADMSDQLQQMQAEMKELKKNYSLVHGPSEPITKSPLSESLKSEHADESDMLPESGVLLTKSPLETTDHVDMSDTPYEGDVVLSSSLTREASLQGNAEVITSATSSASITTKSLYTPQPLPSYLSGFPSLNSSIGTTATSVVPLPTLSIPTSFNLFSPPTTTSLFGASTIPPASISTGKDPPVHYEPSLTNFNFGIGGMSTGSVSVPEHSRSSGLLAGHDVSSATPVFQFGTMSGAFRTQTIAASSTGISSVHSAFLPSTTGLMTAGMSLFASTNPSSSGGVSSFTSTSHSSVSAAATSAASVTSIFPVASFDFCAPPTTSLFPPTIMSTAEATSANRSAGLFQPKAAVFSFGGPSAHNAEAVVRTVDMAMKRPLEALQTTVSQGSSLFTASPGGKIATPFESSSAAPFGSLLSSTLGATKPLEVIGTSSSQPTPSPTPLKYPSLSSLLSAPLSVSSGRAPNTEISFAPSKEKPPLLPSLLPQTVSKPSVSQEENIVLPLPGVVSEQEKHSVSDEKGTHISEQESLSSEDDGDRDSVIFLYEEVPEPEQIAKAEKFMLPQSYYLYEKKHLCSGCRGCNEDVNSSYANTTEPPVTVEDSEKKTSSLASNDPSNKNKFSSVGMLTFLDLVSQSNKDPMAFSRGKGFQFDGTGNQLFSSAQDTQGSDDPEEETNIHFKPIVTLPESYSMTSWDDDAEVLFQHRSKLFRFDAGAAQWKERGVGDIKIMRHRKTAKVRVIMRRDQILKICCNHYITEDMKLMPGVNDKSWIWFTHCDLSDEEPKEEKLAVRFKSTAAASKFKVVFDKCIQQAKNEDISDTDPSPLLPPLVKPVSETWECESCMVMNNIHDTQCVACGTPKPVTFNMRVSKKPEVKTDISAQEDTRSSDDAEEETNLHFKPIVTLPESYSMTSWDGDAEVLFQRRSKLFRFDAGAAQWKERGVGDIKIMKHRKTAKMRVIMRRDQILKICCNHYITEDMKLMPGVNDKSWIWFTHCDLSDEEPKEEKLAVRFKETVFATEFKQTFDKCILELQHPKDVVNTDSSLSTPSLPPVKTESWECQICMVFNGIERSSCVACTKPRHDISGPIKPDSKQSESAKEQFTFQPNLLESVKPGLAVKSESVKPASLTAEKPQGFTMKSGLLELMKPVSSTADKSGWLESASSTADKSQGFAVKSGLLESMKPASSTADKSGLLESASSTADKSQGFAVKFGLLESMKPASTADKSQGFAVKSGLLESMKPASSTADRSGLLESMKPVSSTANRSGLLESASSTADKSQGFAVKSDLLESMKPASSTADRSGLLESASSTPDKSQGFAVKSGLLESMKPASSTLLESASSTADKSQGFAVKSGLLESMKPASSTADKSGLLESASSTADKSQGFAVKSGLLESMKPASSTADKSGLLESASSTADKSQGFAVKSGLLESMKPASSTADKSGLLESASSTADKSQGFAVKSGLLESMKPASSTADKSGLLESASSTADKSQGFAVKSGLLESMKPASSTADKSGLLESASSTADKSQGFAVKSGLLESMKPASSTADKSGLLESASSTADKSQGFAVKSGLLESMKPASSTADKSGLLESALSTADKSQGFAVKSGLLESMKPASSTADKSGLLESALSTADKSQGFAVKSGLLESMKPASSTADHPHQRTLESLKEEDEGIVKSESMEPVLSEDESYDRNSDDQCSSKTCSSIADDQSEKYATSDIVSSATAIFCVTTTAFEKSIATATTSLATHDSASMGSITCTTSPTEVLEKLTICSPFGFDNEEMTSQALSFPLTVDSVKNQPFQFPLSSSQHSYTVPFQFPLDTKGGGSFSKNTCPLGTSTDHINEDIEDTLPSENQLSYSGDSDPSSDGDGSGEDVIFLSEELPEPELVAKAETFMLPRCFYLYEKKPPCPGCRGCNDKLVDADYGEHPVTDDAKSKDLQAKSPPLAELSDQSQEKESRFSSAGMISFSDLVSQSTSIFSNREKGFQFHGTGNQLFSSAQDTQGSDDPEEETNIHFKPIVTLPESYSMTSWDDDAEVLFQHRSKLFRFDAGAAQWKERGVGDIKIMRHRKTAKVRVIMRRDQILKICCNHYITEDMKLMPGVNDKSWIWFTHCDLSDEEPKEEKLAVRFKSTAAASKFKVVFDKCIQQAKNEDISDTDPSPLLPPLVKPVSETWECESCMVMNNIHDTQCLACSSEKPCKTSSANVSKDIFNIYREESNTESIIVHVPSLNPLSPASCTVQDLDSSVTCELQRSIETSLQRDGEMSEVIIDTTQGDKSSEDNQYDGSSENHNQGWNSEKDKNESSDQDWSDEESKGSGSSENDKKDDSRSSSESDMEEQHT